VGDNDRSVGLGLFPDDCQHHACRLYLSGANHGCEDRRLRAAAERLPEDEDDNHNNQERDHPTHVGGGEKCSFDMLGGSASSGDRIGVLVYICGKGTESMDGSSSFGKDPSNDCLYAEVEGSSGRQRQNSVDSVTKFRAGCTPLPIREEVQNNGEYEYEYDFTEDDMEDCRENGDESSHSRMAGLLGEQEGENDHHDEDEEGMHVYFNLNGCPLNVPWRAVSKIADIPWGQTALYPTVSFTVPSATAESDSPSSSQQLQSNNRTTFVTNVSSTSNSSDSGCVEKEKAPGGKEESEAPATSTYMLPAHNTVKIWVS
jgi:hypothetical protein